MKLTRRQAILAAAAMPLSLTIPAAPAFIPPEGWTWDYTSQFFADWELMAIKFNLPTTWQNQEYESALQVTDDVLLFYGIGKPQFVFARSAELQESFGYGDRPDRWILSEHITACGRAFAFCVPGRFSEGLKRELQRPAVENVQNFGLSDPPAIESHAFEF